MSSQMQGWHSAGSGHRLGGTPRQSNTRARGTCRPAASTHLRACRPQVAISYVLFDTWDKYNKTLEDARRKLGARQDFPADLDHSK